MVWALAVSWLASGASAAAGYVVGARRGVRAREALRGEVTRLEARLLAATAPATPTVDASVHDEALRALDELHTRAEAVRAERDHLTTELLRARDEIARLRSDHTRDRDALAEARAETSELRGALSRATEALARAPKEPTRTNGSIDEVRRMLAPLLGRARLDEALAGLDGAGASRGELPRLLDAIAKRGGFESVVLSDDVGLPVAASVEAREVDAVAGVASMLLTMADRVTAAGAPEPRAMLVHDAEHRTLVHRVLRARGERFLLTAVGHGTALGVDALDPTVPRLERLLET